MNNQAVIYCRTATEDKETKSKLARQKQICINFAKSNNYKVIKVLSEVGSGIDSHRPKFLDLIELVETDKAKHVIVSTPDRISRNMEDFAFFKKLLEIYHAQLEYAQ